MSKTKFSQFISLFVLLAFFTSCITTYRQFPSDMIGKEPTVSANEKLYYMIDKFPVLDAGGETALQRVFREKTPFEKTKRVTEVPDVGTFCHVKVDYAPLTFPALIFGYISVSTLTFLPAWSLKDGYRVSYQLYVNGEEKETYEYNIIRKFGLWLPLLSLIWVNIFTYSEGEAFEATAYQFFHESKGFVSGM